MFSAEHLAALGTGPLGGRRAQGPKQWVSMTCRRAHTHACARVRKGRKGRGGAKRSEGLALQTRSIWEAMTVAFTVFREGYLGKTLRVSSGDSHPSLACTVDLLSDSCSDPTAVKT